MSRAFISALFVSLLAVACGGEKPGPPAIRDVAIGSPTTDLYGRVMVFEDAETMVEVFAWDFAGNQVDADPAFCTWDEIIGNGLEMEIHKEYVILRPLPGIEAPYSTMLTLEYDDDEHHASDTAFVRVVERPKY